MKRVDIKTGFICNNNCVFCVQADNKCKGNRSLEEIKKNLDDCKDRCDGVVFTGGEVTVRKDFFEMVKYAKELGYRMIQIQSNGRMFSSLDFCKKTLEAGATEFSPALHGYCAEQHDYLTAASGSFRQTVKGIKNLKSLGAYVLTNSVVVKSNYRDVPKIAQLLVTLDVNQFQFAFVHAMGNAWNNFDSVVPVMSLAVPYIKKGLQVGIDAGKLVMAESIPFCLMKGYEDYVAENFIPETEIRGKKFQDTDDFTSQRKNLAKMKFPQCKKCKYDSKCEGPWREYPEKRGHEEFKAVIDENEISNKDKIVDSNIEYAKSLEKLYGVICFMEEQGFTSDDYYISDVETYALVSNLSSIQKSDIVTNKLDIIIKNDKGLLTKNNKSNIFKDEKKNKDYIAFMSKIGLGVELEKYSMKKDLKEFHVFDKVVKVDKLIVQDLVKHYKGRKTNTNLLNLVKKFIDLPLLDSNLINDLKELEKVLTDNPEPDKIEFSNILSGTSLIKKNKKVRGYVVKNGIIPITGVKIFVSKDASADKLKNIMDSDLCIIEEGSKTSHAASLCRELDKGCIMGVGYATKMLFDGDLIEVDLNDGLIRVISRKASLALSMIVRDEENKMHQCLENIYPVLDEIVIVDTGSKDNTRKIAENYGAKVFDFKWCDDFATARNFSLSKCVSDWILVLDADEVIEPNQIYRIREIINKTDKEAFFLNNIEINKNYITGECTQDKIISQGKVVRLFRNLSHLKYKGRIFEAITCRPTDTDIVFNHYKDISRKDKTTFGVEICEKAYSENKNNPEIFLCLLQFYIMKSDFEKMKGVINAQFPIKVNQDIDYFQKKLDFIVERLNKANLVDLSKKLSEIIKIGHIK